MDNIGTLAQQLVSLCARSGKIVATAESCTGGLIAGAITDIAGSSAALDRGFVTYSNAAKTDMLGVREQLLKTHGAVSQGVAEAMAAGALSNSDADVAVSVTGVAGPDGGSAEKPVGTVWFGLCKRGSSPTSFHRLFAEKNREEVRALTVAAALEAMLEALSSR
ncbi:MAG: CinA family protein [Pseudomonadota bacterium]